MQVLWRMRNKVEKLPMILLKEVEKSLMMLAVLEVNDQR
jgi:hypothetical protein